MSTVSQLPKTYADVNTKNSPSYSDYDNYELSWSRQDKYQIIRKIGRGKYSEVFSGVDISDNSMVVVKILKPVRSRKIKREIKILKNLNNPVFSPMSSDDNDGSSMESGSNRLTSGDTVIKLLGMVKDVDSNTPALIFEHVENVDFRTLYPTFSDMDVRFYMYELLRALDYCHSLGIMHRDVKPHNIMIDHTKRQLKLIDWGLAEFYHPNMEYNVRVASRYYKGPELLVDHTTYHYALDIWSFGCTLAGIVFKKDPFFHGHDNNDQLVKIVRIMGSEKLKEYTNKYSLTLNEFYSDGSLNGHAKKDLRKFITPKNEMYVTPQVLDLLEQVLQYDQQLRPTAIEAMAHTYFDPVRKTS